MTETFQRDQVLRWDKDAFIQREMKVFYIFTYRLAKVGQLVNCTEFSGFTSLDREGNQSPYRNPSLPPLFNLTLVKEQQNTQTPAQRNINSLRKKHCEVNWGDGKSKSRLISVLSLNIKHVRFAFL